MPFFPYTSQSMLKYVGGDFPLKSEMAHAPYYVPLIRLVPFSNQVSYKTSNAPRGLKLLRSTFGEEITVVPRGTHGLQLLLRDQKLSVHDEIAVITTFDNHYLSGCVSTVVEKYAQLERKVTHKTRLVITVNEWGIRPRLFGSLAKYCSERNIPLIEDSCLSMPHIDAQVKIKNPDLEYYRLFSFTKIFPMQFGGLVVGRNFSKRNLVATGLYDREKTGLIAHQLAEYLPKLAQANRTRRKNWRYLNRIFAPHSYSPFFQLKKGDIPYLYMLKLESAISLKKVKRTLNDFGIDCAPYWKNGAIGLPCHQELQEDHFQYIKAAVLKACRAK